MGGSQIWLDTKETLTVNEMLKAICIVSANDCVVAMAEYISGSEEAFVEKMNERAKELGMNDTCFKNCHGIDEDGHVTSSYDIALMSRELLINHQYITNYTTIYMDTLRDGQSQIVNTNKSTLTRIIKIIAVHNESIVFTRANTQSIVGVSAIQPSFCGTIRIEGITVGGIAADGPLDGCSHITGNFIASYGHGDC